MLDVRSSPESGLKSDIAPCPKSARSGQHLVGVAAAAQSDVLIAGVAGLVAGAISMAAGATTVGAVINLAEPGTG
jgi:hypothetical protein